MKKIVFFVSALAVLSLTSCKKDWICKGGSYDGSTCLKCNKVSKDLLKTTCEAGGGSLEKK